LGTASAWITHRGAEWIRNSSHKKKNQPKLAYIY